ncbi:hypothetical protein KI387_010351, partial [Taxus chinensis]
ERGEIFFFYRPKVNQEEAHSVDDVQKMYIVLRPESGERKVEEKQSSDAGKEGVFKKSESAENAQQESPGSDEQKKEGGTGSENIILKLGICSGLCVKKVNIEKLPLMRFIVMGRKSLPDPSKRTRPYWGFVEIVTTKPEDIKKALSEEQYETTTRGTRVKPAARPLAEGVYRILRHYPTSKGKEKGMHTHLVYKLELPRPEVKHEPQESLNVEPEGSFIIQIKNPEQASPPNAGLQRKRKATFPAHLQGQIGSHRFVPVDPPDFLNYEGCEFILISASDDIDAELGLDIKTEDMTDENYRSCSDLVSMFGEISSVKPLIEGTWA